jgi:hypothetical protein
MKCVHHWVCATPSGPTSESRCCKCGATKEFSNRLICKRVDGLNSWVSPDWQQVTALTEASALLRNQQIVT